MPSVIFTDAQVLLATSTAAVGSSATATGTGATTPFDLSDFVTAVRISYTADEHDDTVMGLTAHSRVQGLFSYDVELELLQDFTSTNVTRLNSTGHMSVTGIDKLFFDLIDNKAKVACFIKPVASVARSSDNPEYHATVRVRSHQPMTGAVGDLLKTTVPLMSAGNLLRLVGTT